MLASSNERRLDDAPDGAWEGAMTDRARRLVGLVIGPLLILVGLWTCAEGIWLGKLNGIFWIGPFLAMAGGLWLVSDWFDF